MPDNWGIAEEMVVENALKHGGPQAPFGNFSFFFFFPSTKAGMNRPERNFSPFFGSREPDLPTINERHSSTGGPPQNQCETPGPNASSLYGGSPGLSKFMVKAQKSISFIAHGPNLVKTPSQIAL